MKEKTTISRSKQRSLLTSVTEDETFVAQILLDLPSMIWNLESGSSLKWGIKRRRSRFNDLSTSTSFQNTGIEIEERQRPQPKAAAAAEEVAATASPVTPLSFSPSESDEKSGHLFKRCSTKRSREKYIAMIEELTQRRDLLRQEITNGTNYYNKLIAHNSELKAIKHELLNSYQRVEEPKVEASRGDSNFAVELTQHNDSRGAQPQPLTADQMAENFQHSIGPIVVQFHSSYNGLGLTNRVGPHGIPDLNISAEETFEVDLSWPLDVSRDFTDRRARFAEARRRRMDIIKIKSVRSASCGVKLTKTR